MQFSSLLFAATLLLPALAHPGVHEPDDLVKRTEVWSHAKRSVADCTASLKGRSLMARAAARRANYARSLREERGIGANAPVLHRRDFATHANTTHNSNLTSMSPNVDPETLFSGGLNCVLAPEVTQGPYFVTGEYVRNDVRECQEGVDLFLDMQFVDVNTCEPIPDIFLDIWHANSTGVYSGIVASGNGDSSDLTNLDKTFLRGLAKTNDDGVVQFATLFPGHYQGRATHVHVVAHSGGLQNLNGTYSGGNITHVGQLFFDESIRSAVETVAPYSGNTQPVTSNLDDMWAIVADEGDDSKSDFDPFVEYALLGENVEDGLLAWISIGVDPTADNTVEQAATLTEDGGVVNPDFALGGGAGGPGGNGTMPSGAPPGGMGAPPS
ncbi:extracellular dioxygenase [Geopyxis carbonaria]|nr:extracellular dioxygenase [Geopyxis carbonaria]